MSFTYSIQLCPPHTHPFDTLEWVALYCKGYFLEFRGMDTKIFFPINELVKFCVHPHFIKEFYSLNNSIASLEY